MKNNLMKYVFYAALCLVLTMCAVNPAAAQTVSPELAVAGIPLGDEAAAKAILQSYSPRYDNERNLPTYYFYNGGGNQVMAVTAHSKEHPFLVVAIEVFAVGESYEKKHYQMEEVKSFVTESGFYIGERQSAMNLMFAVPNVTGVKDIIAKKGLPQADEKEDKVRTLRYQIGEVKQLETKAKAVNFGTYTAEYRFYKNRLKRYRIAVEAADSGKQIRF